MSQSPLFVAFGHHKSASMWVHAIVDRVCLDLGLRKSAAFLPPDFGGDLRAFIEKERPQFFLYGNADFNHVRNLDLANLRGFHYFRDPRDVIVSGYFSHRNTHSTEQWESLLDYREKLQAVGKEEGLHMELAFAESRLQEIRGWRDCPADVRIERHKIEELTASPYRKMLDIFSAMGLVDESYYSPSKRFRFLLSKGVTRLRGATGIAWPGAVTKLPAERVLGILHECDFKQRTKGRKPGEEDRGSHFRKGVHGDWLNHFTLGHLAEFKQRYEDLLFQLGYETEADWDRKYIPLIEQREQNAASLA